MPVFAMANSNMLAGEPHTTDCGFALLATQANSQYFQSVCTTKMAVAAINSRCTGDSANSFELRQSYLGRRQKVSYNDKIRKEMVDLSSSEADENHGTSIQSGA